MDARSILFATALFCSAANGLLAQGFAPQGRSIGAARASAQSQNFVVFASTQEAAQQVAQAAETYRTELANHWLGRSLPPWHSKCPIVVDAGENLGAGGETTFTLTGGTIARWQMRVQGSYTRILDSVLPHEITHTVLATHFSQWDRTVPRWADEGASTTVEHMDERSKNDRMLTEFLTSGRGIPFATLFALKEYPADILPLYAQGYSLSMFLIGQGGPRKFVKFLETGVTTENWIGALRQHYGYEQLGRLQVAWNQWVADGGGPVEEYTAIAMNNRASGATLASATAPAQNAATNNSVALASASQDRQVSPGGRFAVGRAPQSSIAISDGFEPIRSTSASSAAGLPTDPRSLQVASLEQSSAPNARLAAIPSTGTVPTDLNKTPWTRRDTASNTSGDDQSTTRSVEESYNFEPLSPVTNRTSALQQPYQGVGQSPASIQFGPAEPLIR